LIINADDFGMSYEVNEGIKRCIDAGIVNSVSLMVNMPYFDDAVQYLRSKPHVSVGLHFNITEGSPMGTPKSRSALIREDNNFYDWPYLAFKLLTHNYFPNEIKDALKTQYKKLEKTGLKITHIDSHNHIHLYPSIYKLVLDFATRKNIRSLRSRNFNILMLTNRLRVIPTLKEIVILLLCIINNRLFTKKNKEIIEIVGIYDMSWDGNLTKDKICRVIAHCREGITEVICHPAVLSKHGNPKFLKPRYQTLSILLDKSFKECLLKNNVQMYHRNNSK